MAVVVVVAAGPVGEADGPGVSPTGAADAEAPGEAGGAATVGVHFTRVGRGFGVPAGDDTNVGVGMGVSVDVGTSVGVSVGVGVSAWLIEGAAARRLGTVDGRAEELNSRPAVVPAKARATRATKATTVTSERRLPASLALMRVTVTFIGVTFFPSG